MTGYHKRVMVQMVHVEANLTLLNELNTIIEHLPSYLSKKGWESLLITKHPPVIHRLSLQTNEDRALYLHKLHYCGDKTHAYMHSHPWPCAVHVVQGGYEMGVGFSKDLADSPDALYTTRVYAGHSYEMNSADVWHYTKPIGDTYSIMLVGRRWRKRRAQNTEPLNWLQRDQLRTFFEEWAPQITKRRV